MSLLKNRLSRRQNTKEQDSSILSNATESNDNAENSNNSDSNNIFESDIIRELKLKIEKINLKHIHPDNKASEKLSLETDNSKNCEHVIEHNNLKGQVKDTSLGEVWVNREIYTDYCHGNEPASQYLESGEALGILARDEKIEKLNPQKALFIDTETTGLSSGSGTLPFLIGLGWFEDNSFIVEHLFCRNPGEEPAQLELLAEHMKKAEYLVSFNGKSFDIPLINTRFIINRIENPGYNLPHLDLLHVSRRIFGKRLNDRSLQNLERVVLGFTRHGDIPGSEIPGVYKNYLRGLDNGEVAKILEHNALDIVALAALGGVLDKMYNDPDTVNYVKDSLGLAQEAFGAGKIDKGRDHLIHAEDFGTGDEKIAALHMGAKHAKKHKDFVKAKELFVEILKRDISDLTANFNLAKYYEHHEKDYKKAIYHAKQSEELEGSEASLHRQNRLLRKLKK
ncbi:MAG: ribonuclease H-like domain-containing protein [Deltaproteobacteria bacterium]|nr:ribonuclease H-like domain-containing protein [Deltaproteobacteria bacterium]